MVVNKMGGVHPVSTSWAIPSAYEKQNDGESGPTVGRSFRHYEGHRPDALQGSRWGGGNQADTGTLAVAYLSSFIYLFICSFIHYYCTEGKLLTQWAKNPRRWVTLMSPSCIVKRCSGWGLD